MRSVTVLLATLLLFLFLGQRVAHAEDGIIKHPGDHPDYRFEAEPHGLLGFGRPFERGSAAGVGFRGTFILLKNGFVPSINNSVGIGVGGDVMFAGRSSAVLLVPVVMQWNFWLSTHWSVFGEPGVGFAFGASHVVHPVISAGGRYHFNEKIALTLRAGYPALSVGVSFFF